MTTVLPSCLSWPTSVQPGMRIVTMHASRPSACLRTGPGPGINVLMVCCSLSTSPRNACIPAVSIRALRRLSRRLTAMAVKQPWAHSPPTVGGTTSTEPVAWSDSVRADVSSESHVAFCYIRQTKMIAQTLVSTYQTSCARHRRCRTSSPLAGALPLLPIYTVIRTSLNSLDRFASWTVRYATSFVPWIDQGVVARRAFAPCDRVVHASERMYEIGSLNKL